MVWSDLTKTLLLTCLLLVLEIYSTKPTNTKSWARNLQMLNLTLSPPSRSDDGSLALVSCLFRWIQICIGSPMRRSSLLLEIFFQFRLHKFPLYETGDKLSLEPYSLCI